MHTTYDVHTDEVLQALIREAAADPEVLGLVLTGSRAVGAVTPESDYDLIFVVTDAALARYEQTHTAPARGMTITPPISTADIWHASPSNLQRDTVVAWMLPAYAEARILFDRTGETTRLLDALQHMPAEHAAAAVAGWYDAYLNGVYRSLKAWRRGNELGARLEAAQTAAALLHVLFGLERHWRPFSSRLMFHLDKLDGQGWQPGEVRDILLDLISTGDPRRQQVVAQRVAALLRDRGFGHVYDGWEGQIDQALTWNFS
jgi:esterase/lipase superfamily enzyme